MADFDEVAQLLHIFKGTHEHGDTFKHIRDAAWQRLKEINDEHAPKKDEPEPSIEPSTDQVQAESEVDHNDELLGETHDEPEEPQSQRRA